MITNTENSHLHYWFGDDRNKIWRTDDLEYTTMSVGPCLRKPMTLRAELIRNARILHKLYPDLIVFMSGGLDCEIALRSFLAAGIVPKLLTIKFENDQNLHDIGPMLELTAKMGLPITVIDFNMEAFARSGEAYEIGKKYQCYSMYQQMLLKITETISDPSITIDDAGVQKLPFTNWETNETSFKWVFIRKEDQDGTWRRFNDKTGIPALNNFYTFSPETMCAFLDIPLVNMLINDKIPHKYGWTSSKFQIYSTLGYNITDRQKYHGVENYYNHWDEIAYNLHANGILYTPRVYSLPCTELLQNFKFEKETICAIA